MPFSFLLALIGRTQGIEMSPEIRRFILEKRANWFCHRRHDENERLDWPYEEHYQIYFVFCRSDIGFLRRLSAGFDVACL